MPGDLTSSPFSHTRGRQDFNETLYVTMDYNATQPKTATFKWTLSTTVEYFEVPNDKLGNLPGPLLSKDPFRRGPCSTIPCWNQLAEDRSQSVVSA